MAGPLPTVPTSFLVQSGNGLVYLSWGGAATTGTTYNVFRSTDNVTFSQISTSGILNHYSDTTASTGIIYYYSVQSQNGNGASNKTAAQPITLLNYGQQSLGSIRLSAQQRADMVNNDFITTQEWNSYINHSYMELYDLLVGVYADEYYVNIPSQFVTDGRYPALYPLPVNLYKLMGVDLSISASTNGWVTLQKFSFIARNRYIYGNTPTSFLGILNLRYRMVGNNIQFVPQPAANQTVQIWYIPKPTSLLADSDILDGISGWDEYIIVDAAIKALQKEESDVTVLLAQKEALKQRIEGIASNRDAGLGECATDVRRLDGSYFSDPFGNGPTGGWAIAFGLISPLLFKIIHASNLFLTQWS